MRDDFSVATRELLAKRVGVVCSNPECQRPTSGPQEDPTKAVNLGVAAHISAASPGGPRYQTDLSAEQRCDSSNGIWLCATCAKLIDSDVLRFDRETLEGWKRAAERAASLALIRGRQHIPMPSAPPFPPPSPPTARSTVSALSSGSSQFAKIERLMPALLEEMREDLRTRPTAREFVVLEKGWVYNSGGDPYLAYYSDGHEDLPGKLQVLENHGLIRDVTRTNVQRFRLEEQFVDYLAEKP